MANRLLGHNAPLEREPEEKKPPKWKGFLYHCTTGEPKVFYSEEERDKALKTRDWVDTPAKVDKGDDYEAIDLELLASGHTKGLSEDLPKKEEHVNWSEKIKFRDSNLPPASSLPSAGRKYVSTMNVKELIERGAKVGIDFGTPETCPTKQEMKRKIRFAEEKKK